MHSTKRYISLFSSLQRFTAILLVFCFSFGLPAHAAILGEFSIKDEAELGRKFNLLIRSRFNIIEDPEVTSYMEDMKHRIVRAMPPQPFPLTITVVDNNAMNAFATAGGYVFVFSGMILNVEHESELAGVIAHELAHVSQRHIAKHMERAQLVNIGAMLGVLAGALIGTKDVGGAVAYGSIAGAQSAYLKYSRDDEREADQVGLNYLIGAGYRPQGMTSAFEKIRKRKYLSGGSIPSYLSTHPGVEERIGYLEEREKRLSSQILSRKEKDDSLHRVQTLIRGRYSDPQTSLQYFTSSEGTRSCLDQLGKAMVLDRLHRIQEAEDAFTGSLECGREDPLVLREAGRFYFTQGKFDKAGSFLQEAVLRNPDDLIALFYFARLQGEKGKTDEAVDNMKRVLRHLPENADVHYHLGRIQGKGGDVFSAHLHLGYSAVYQNDKKKSHFHIEKAKTLAKTSGEKDSLSELQKVYEERSEFWKKQNSK